MRILVVSHLPLNDTFAGRLARVGIERLRAGGHDVRALTIDASATMLDRPYLRRVICSADDPRAPLQFQLPKFNASRSGGFDFTQLSDRQLSDYRDVLREEFDREIDLHDPHVVHTQQLWLFSHLALEAGVPYVVSAHHREIATGRVDNRYRRFMVQAAENAGRILTHSDDAHAGVRELLGDGHERLVRYPLPDTDAGLEGAWWQPLPAHYRDAYVERFGREPE